MLAFNQDWAAGNGRVEIEIARSHEVKIWVSCTKTVQLRGLRGSEEVPLKTGSEFTLRAKVQGFTKLVLIGTGRTPFGYRVLETEKQYGEPINNENPPSPPMPNNSNLLLQMQNIFREERKSKSAPYMDPEDLPFQHRYTMRS